MLFHFRLWPSHLHHAPHLFHVGVVWRPFKPVKNRKTGRKKKSTQSFPFTLDVDHMLCPQVEATATFGSAFYLNACRQLQRASWCLKDIHPPACCCVCVCAGLFNFLCVFAQKRAEEKERKKKLNHRRRDVLYNPTASLLWHHISPFRKQPPPWRRSISSGGHDSQHTVVSII